jgi:hypothetical protein
VQNPNLHLAQPRPTNSNSVSSSHNRNVSFWNINGPPFDPNIHHSPSNSKKILRQTDEESISEIGKSKQMRKNDDDSALEINENIRLIEELLVENDDVSLKTYSENLESGSIINGSNFNFPSCAFPPNFGMMSAIKNENSNLPNEKMHSKALSDDFDINKKRFEEKNKQHGRVQSNFEQNNNLFDKERNNKNGLDIDI